MKQMSPAEFSAAVVKEMENNPQYKIKQNMSTKTPLDPNTPPIFIKNITDHKITITSPDYEASILKQDALDYARKTMICETCEHLTTWVRGAKKIYQCFFLSCSLEEEPNIDQTNNFGCIYWEQKQ